MKKTLTTLILMSLFGSLVGGLFFFIKPLKDFGISYTWIALSLGQITGLILIFFDSKIHRSRYFRFIILGVIILFIGISFRKSHWPFGRTIVLFGLITILITYLLRFINKKRKNFMDFIKVIWLTTMLTGYYFKISHWPYGDLIDYISIGVFWIGLIYILFLEFGDIFKRKLNKTTGANNT
jgi:hypothetical protein